MSYTDDIFFALEQAVFNELETLGQDIQGWVQQEISTPCPAFAFEHSGLKVHGVDKSQGPHHSPPGSPPYLETGWLSLSIDNHVEGAHGNPIATLYVTAHAPYAADLEFGTNHMAARPFMAPGQEHWAPIVPQRLQSVIS